MRWRPSGTNRTADERESAMDRRERQLDARAAELGVAPVSAAAAADRLDARAARDLAHTDRVERAAVRDAAGGP